MSNPAELSVFSILRIAKIAQYLATDGISASNNFRGKAVDERLARMIYCERMAVQFIYDQNPNEPTLQGTANYLFAILGRYGQLALARLAGLSIAPPVVSGPLNQTVNVGQTAVFTVSVVSSVAYTLQWYDSSGNPILGATGLSYSFINAQLTDSGKTFYVKATNSGGTVQSVTAVLVVQSAIQVFAWYGTVDPFPALSGGTDNLPYQITQNISHNAPFVITWPLAAANNQFEVIKVPITESVKTIWSNTPLNQGIIPDAVFRATFTIGGFYYIVSRNAMSLDSTVLTETFS